MHGISSADKIKKHLEQRCEEIDRGICMLSIYIQIDQKFRKTEEKLYKKVKTKLVHELLHIYLEKKVLGEKTNLD